MSAWPNGLVPKHEVELTSTIRHYNNACDLLSIAQLADQEEVVEHVYGPDMDITPKILTLAKQITLQEAAVEAQLAAIAMAYLAHTTDHFKWEPFSA